MGAAFCYLGLRLGCSTHGACLPINVFNRGSLGTRRHDLQGVAVAYTWSLHAQCDAPSSFVRSFLRQTVVSERTTADKPFGLWAQRNFDSTTPLTGFANRSGTGVKCCHAPMRGQSYAGAFAL